MGNSACTSIIQPIVKAVVAPALIILGISWRLRERISTLTANMRSARLGFETLVVVGIIVLAHFRNPSIFRFSFIHRHEVHLMISSILMSYLP